MQDHSSEDKASTKQENLAPSPATSAAESLPRRFERFTLLQHLARGGMGEVYLATSPGIEGAERPCVIKIIRREHAEDRSFLARFLDEARIQAQLQHPGVAQILEAASDQSGKPYVVVEHIEGKNLGEIRARANQLGARITWPDAVAIAVCIADALAHVHERTDAGGAPLDIVHRDLSPQNVMLSYAGDVKLIDFGTARGQNRRCQTIAGIVFAKPGYVAPEVANNTPGAAPSDIYALGIMLWELLSGRRFLSGDASEHLALVGAGQRNPPPLTGVTDAPRELDSIISRLTATRVQDRYASAREATMDLVMLLKRAPSLSDGERSVRARVANLMQKLYPSEPARSRTEFAKLVRAARALETEQAAAPQQAEPSAPSGDPTLLDGTRYRLVREIARGAMGVVHEAYHLDLARTVALKVLPSDKAESDEQLSRFRAEARAIARLHHDNLVRLYDFGVSSGGQPYFAMELLEGETLEAYIAREKGMDWRDAVRVGLQACAALEAAHAATLVHRDIKPANLFMTRSGTLKLLDFGIAQLPESPAPKEQALTPALSMLGTPEYMAPEQTSQAADARSDLYALGVVLYELVTGRLPHEAGSAVAILDAKTKHQPEPPSKCAPQRGLPPALDAVLLRALAARPEQRFQSAEEMRAALAQVLTVVQARFQRRRRLAASAALGVLLLAGVGAAGALKGAALGSSAVAVAQKPRELKPVAELVANRMDEVVTAAGEQAALAPPAPAEAELAAKETESDAEQAGDGADEVAADEASDETGDKPESAAKSRETEEKVAGAGDPLEARIQAARELMAAGKEIKGFNELRYLGRLHYGDARAVRAWSEAAAQMKAWGEAARTAQRWADIDGGVESLVHLARMDRAVGQRERAITLLKRVVRQHPDSNDAKQLLASFGWDPERVARR